MVNDAVSESPERALALSYAPVATRAAVTTLFALDTRLRRITLAARDPLIGAMRLTWWAEALARLDTAPPPAEPLLQALVATVLPRGVTGAALATTIDGWERLLDVAPDLAAFADQRGGRLFEAVATLLGVVDPRVKQVGAGWALIDLADGWPALATEARALAAASLAGAWSRRWPRALRPLGALGLSARFDLAGRTPPGSPRRVARLLAHRLTGR